jgi:hypothetical protein
MFALPAVSTPTLRLKMTPFTPPTNYSKVKETPAPTPLQRQGVSTQTLASITLAFEALQEYLNKNIKSGILSGEEREYGQKELEKWSKIVQAYCQFFTTPRPNRTSEKQHLIEQLSKFRATSDHSTFTVPLYQLNLERRSKQPYDSQLLCEWKKLGERIDGPLNNLTQQPSEEKIQDHALLQRMSNAFNSLEIYMGKTIFNNKLEPNEKWYAGIYGLETLKNWLIIIDENEFAMNTCYGNLGYRLKEQIQKLISRIGPEVKDSWNQCVFASSEACEYV